METQQPATAGRGCLIGAAVGLAALLLVVEIGGDRTRPSAPLASASIEDIYVAFRDNPVAADRRFGQGPVAVTGKVEAIAGTAQAPELSLWTPHGMTTWAPLGPKDTARVAATKIGETVTVRCDRLRGALNRFILEDCSLAP